MSDFAEIKGLVEKINPVLVELRGEIDGLKANKPVDVVTEEKHNKMVESITAGMAEMQAKQAKIEAALQRPGSDGKSDRDTEIETKHGEAFQS